MSPESEENSLSTITTACRSRQGKTPRNIRFTKWMHDYSAIAESHRIQLFRNGLHYFAVILMTLIQLDLPIIILSVKVCKENDSASNDLTFSLPPLLSPSAHLLTTLTSRGSLGWWVGAPPILPFNCSVSSSCFTGVRPSTGVFYLK